MKRTTAITVSLLSILCVACGPKNKQNSIDLQAITASVSATDSIYPVYAQGFEVKYLPNHVRLVDLRDPQNESSNTFHYALVPRGTKPERIPSDYTVIETPVRSVICMTSLQLSNFIKLEACDKVVGITSTRHLFNKEMNERLKSGKTAKIGIEGNFDDAQTGVKTMFGDSELAKELDANGFQFSSANSINIGRLVPQVVYYVYAYTRLLANNEIKNGDRINVVVPTGNFGNILAAYYAKNMGLPIAKLICASNENKVLFDFFKTGTYDRNRKFVLTSSPSMDILISSNLERLIYRIAGDDANANKELMDSLKKDGRYTITDDMRAKLEDFYGNYASEAETAEAIKSIYYNTGYVIDTHTAVAASVYKKYVAETSDETKTVIASTASPFKFTRSVMDAIDKAKYDKMTDFELVDELSRIANVAVPQAIEDIRTAPVLHDRVCDKTEMKAVVKDILGIK